MKKFNPFYAYLFFMIPLLINAQDPTERCRQEEATAAMYARYPQAKIEADNFEIFTKNYTQARTENQSYVIPVVFHVFGSDFAGQTVDDNLIINALARLNEDFQGLNDDYNSVSDLFAPIKSPMDITFALPTLDPDGQPTSGINYYPALNGFGNPTSSTEDQIRQYAWDNYKYMNVYIQADLYNDGDLFNSGVAWLPNTTMSDNNIARVVYNGRYLGTNTDKEFASVLTHEFGHWLNLYHTFNGSNPCKGSGDFVDDTPPTKSNVNVCNYTNSTCPRGSIANGENYMDYGNCYRMFTQGQVARMTSALQHPARISLWQESNLIATGLSNSTPVLAASFTASATSVTVGEGVTFSDRSTGDGITSWEWSFPGGTPSSHSGQTPPVINYNTAGNFDVSLTVTDPSGTDAQTNAGYITVSETQPEPEPTYCTGSPSFTIYSHISNVSFGSINNTTGQNSYTYYSNLSTTLTPGSVNPISISVNRGGVGSADNNRVIVWIDWNRDGDFVDSGEKVVNDIINLGTADANGNVLYSGNINVPVSAISTVTRMRVLTSFKRGKDGTTPCESFESGELEDYVINVSPSSAGPDKVLNALTIFPNPSDGIFNFTEPVFEVQLFSVSGQLVYSHESTKAIREIEIKGQRPGLYLLKVLTSSGHKSARVSIR